VVVQLETGEGVDPMTKSIWTVVPFCALAGTALKHPASAAEATHTHPAGYEVRAIDGAFEDIFLDLNDAVVGRGLVIDYTGHVDTMLERTAETVGSVSEKGRASPYSAAKYIQFCSAALTHEVLSANPLNLAICPYVVFAFELHTKPGVTHVGYRRPIGDPSRISRRAIAKVEALLREIVDEVAN